MINRTYAEWIDRAKELETALSRAQISFVAIHAEADDQSYVEQTAEHALDRIWAVLEEDDKWEDE